MAQALASLKTLLTASGPGDAGDILAALDKAVIGLTGSGP